jgi:hypothetical protein
MSLDDVDLQNLMLDRLAEARNRPRVRQDVEEVVLP